ncbi:MAG: DUF2339 domain-containing protein [Chryseolinea sp.]
MEALALIIAIIILLVVIALKRDTASRLKNLEAKFDILREELKKARSGVAAKPEEKIQGESTVISHKATVIQTPPIEKVSVDKPVELATPEVARDPIRVPELAAFKDRAISQTAKVLKPAIVEPPKPKRPGFFERNPDLEKFIGENLANKIGIGVLVLGIGFFVKFAIDQDWIGEIGRVCIGILCGGILLGVAHYLRKTFSAFSSVLVGGGIAVLYLTIALAFHEYHIFNQTAAFIIMVIITAFAVVFSLAYNRVELAVLSIIGGFGSPFMVSTGQGNYAALFTYILILDVGMLVLAYYKKWNLVNIVSYGFTILLFGIWLSQLEEGNGSMIIGAMIFATLFYLVFFAMNIINNIKERTAFKSVEISILLSNTFFYFGAGMTILSNPLGHEFKGLFTAVLGIFNFVFAYMLYRNSRVDKTLVFMLIGLVLTFISLAAPVQLEGNYITLFWAAETVLVLWLSQKSGIRLMKLGSLVLMGLMLVSLLMDWAQIYLDQPTQGMMIILNKGYITGIFSVVSVAITIVLLRNEKSENVLYISQYRNVLLVTIVGLLYFSQLLELQYQLFEYGFDYSTQNIMIGAYNMLFILLLLFAERKWVKERTINFAFAFWGLLVMVTYVGFYHWQNIEARNDFLLNNGAATGFVFHYIVIALVIAIGIITLRKIQGEIELNKVTYNAYSWIYVAFFIFLASSELDHIVVVALGATSDSIDHILSQNHKIGYPILWGLASFLLIYVGLAKKRKHLRIVSLSLFLITLLKLFIVDIRGISEGGKIAAFICLGVLLLIVSFMYQRLKKILLADEASAIPPQTEIK